MSEYDADLLQILDKKKSSNQPNPTTKAQQLAMTSNNPNFNQMMVEINQMPPSFQENFNFPLNSTIK